VPANPKPEIIPEWTAFFRGWLAQLNSGAGILSLAANIEPEGQIIARRSGS
jgi:hypothetical protein